MAFPIDSPLPIFYDRNGDVLDAGYVYIGTPNLNPITSPVSVYWDAAQTIPAPQPLRTVRGFIARNGAPADVYVTGDYSILVRDRNQQLVLNEPTSGTIARAIAVLGSPADGSGVDLVANADRSFATIAAMRAHSVPVAVTGRTYVATVQEHTAGTAIGGGQFRWDETSTATDDNGYVINPTGNLNPGRYIRVISGPTIDPRWWGIIPDLGTDQTTNWNACMAYAKAIGGGHIELPSGVIIISRLTMHSRLTISGPRSATLRQLAAANQDFVVLETNTTYQTALLGFTLDGNRAAQASGHVVQYQNNASLTPFVDSNHVINRMFVLGAKQDGINFGNGVREAKVTDTYIQQCDRYGVSTAATDSTFIGVTTGSSGDHGFLIGGAATKFIGCKSFGAGRLTVNTSNGYLLQTTGRNTLSACEAQECNNNGLLIDGCDNNEVYGFYSDSNRNAGVFINNARNNTVYAKVGNTGGLLYTHITALQFGGTRTSNTIRIATDMTNRVTNSNDGNDVVVGQNTSGVTSAAYAANIATDPALARTYNIGTLTGNVTIDNPVTATNRLWRGARLRFVFTQDGVGGRTISFGTDFRENWTPVTTANAINAIEFEYNGALWIQVAQNVGLV